MQHVIGHSPVYYFGPKPGKQYACRINHGQERFRDTDIRSTPCSTVYPIFSVGWLPQPPPSHRSIRWRRDRLSGNNTVWHRKRNIIIISTLRRPSCCEQCILPLFQAIWITRGRVDKCKIGAQMQCEAGIRRCQKKTITFILFNT